MGMNASKRRWLVWLAAAATIGVTASAGVWQLGRAEQKKSAEAALHERRQLPAWGNSDWPCAKDPAAAMLPAQRPALLRGHWLAEHTVFLDNRPMEGGSGFVIVTPLRLSPGDQACPGAIVLVQRGWVARDMRDRLRLPEIDTPSDEVTVLGRVVLGLSQVYQLGVESTPARAPVPVVRQNADPAFWSSRLGQSPLAGAVLQTQAALPSDAAVLRRQWPEPGQGQDKHLAYAAQWFAMAAVVTGLTLWFQVILPRRQRRS
jgi:surfeit locus 1 family protein